MHLHTKLDSCGYAVLQWTQLHARPPTIFFFFFDVAQFGPKLFEIGLDMGPKWSKIKPDMGRNTYRFKKKKKKRS